MKASINGNPGSSEPAPQMESVTHAASYPSGHSRPPPIRAIWRALCPKPSSPPLMNWNAPSARCARIRTSGGPSAPCWPITWAGPAVVSGRGHFRRAGRARIYLKREDLNHTGAHKINNCLGQILLARRMGKRRIIAETGAGQHGVATATVCALYGLQCVVYMGAQDMARQSVNVRRMLARRCAVHTGTATLKDAMNEAARLDRQRRRHLLSAGHRRGPASLSLAGARVPARDRRRDARADPGPDRPPARRHGRLRRRRFERAGLLLSLPGRRGRADDRRGSGRAGPGQRRSRGQPGGRLPRRAARLPQLLPAGRGRPDHQRAFDLGGPGLSGRGAGACCCTTASAWTMSA